MQAGRQTNMQRDRHTDMLIAICRRFTDSSQYEAHDKTNEFVVPFFHDLKSYVIPYSFPIPKLP